MKKTIMGAALFLVISFTQVSAAGLGSAAFGSAAFGSAAGLAQQKGQPRVARNILSTQLPAALLADIKTDYKDYWITDLVQKEKRKKSDYFITLENADQTVQLSSSDGDNWVVVNTTVKVN
jgi:hypothetical protein